MLRNLDTTALRSFVAIADSGGVTRAAGFLNLTQSAVSMQIRRLEEMLGCDVLDRRGRQVTLTSQGEELLSYARRILALNDEAMGRLTTAKYEGEIVLGVPHDIVYPAIPQVLKQFASDFPRMKVQLVSSLTRVLREEFAKGQCDLIVTTEVGCDAGGETLASLPLIWVGAPGGTAWRQRPLRLAYEERCIFRQGVQAALDAAGIPWEMAVESSSTRAVEATVSADLAVHTLLAGSEPPHVERIAHGGSLPELQRMNINLYLASARMTPAVAALGALIRRSFTGQGARPMRGSVLGAANHDLAG